MVDVQWLTTRPNQDPRAYHGGADQGQRGWRVHAVIAAPTETFATIDGKRSLCGLLPAHGWGIDLFIERQCTKCIRAITKIKEKP